MSAKAAVEKFGLAKYNEECRSIVMRFREEWRATIERLGRWVDFDNDYKACTVSGTTSNNMLTSRADT
jgi:isoleucyl-tRNA synthetase